MPQLYILRPLQKNNCPQISSSLLLAPLKQECSEKLSVSGTSVHSSEHELFII